MLIGYEDEYQHEENSFIAWEAFLFCCEWKIKLPELILRYLEDTGKNLLQLSGKTKLRDLKEAL
jgi:hypothetical protein